MNSEDIDLAFSMVLGEEAKALMDATRHCLNAEEACRVLHESNHVAVTGIGKAGLVGKKISATLSSTGTPSFFLDPVNALHGDIGALSKNDGVLIFSNSGETLELVRLMPYIEKTQAITVLVTGSRESTLADMVDVVVCYGEQEEAGNGLAPSCSTTCMMAVGDALALTAMELRGFTREDYARNHPGGSLGGKALTAKDVMRKPVVGCNPTDSIVVAAMMMTRHKVGICCVIDDDGYDGVLTDGDIRRKVAAGHRMEHLEVQEAYTKGGTVVSVDTTVQDVMDIARSERVNAVPVLDGAEVVGVIDIQDIIGMKLDV